MFPSLWPEESREAQEFTVKEGIQDIPPRIALNLINQGRATLIDVRDPDEVALGYIPDAINIPLDKIRDDALNPLLPNRDRILILYCKTGKRALEGCEKLKKAGYRYLLNMGGISSWSYGTIVP